MHQGQIAEREHAENAVREQQRMGHVYHEYRQNQRCGRCRRQEPLPMAIVEAMPLLQRGLRREPRVQQPVRHVEQPRAQR